MRRSRILLSWSSMVTVWHQHLHLWWSVFIYTVADSLVKANDEDVAAPKEAPVSCSFPL